MRRNRLGVYIGVAATALAVSSAGFAQDRPARDYDIAARDLKGSLREVARESGLELLAVSDDLRGKPAPALKGYYTPEEALALLLRGTGLSADISGRTIYIRGRTESPRAPEVDLTSAGSDIVVTGSRIRGVIPPGSNVTKLGRAEIEQSGYSTVQQLLQAVPQNYGGGSSDSTTGLTSASGAGQNTSYGSSVNLRGLGPSSTLVLLNGRRPPLGGIGGTFADISMIPTSAIERIEVLADGASAIYGSDAVAGVVNIIPRSHFTGLEASVRYGSADGDFSEVQASLIAGTKWGSGRAVLAYEYNMRGSLAAADRAYVTEDLRAFGGPDYRTAFANPGTIIAAGKTYAIPGNQNGIGLTAAKLTAGTSNFQDGWLDTDVLPRQRRHSVYGTVAQDLSGKLSIFAEVLYSRRSYEKRQTSAGTNSTLTVLPTNPFYVDPIGTHQAIQVRYSFLDDFGPIRNQGRVDAYGGTVGARLSLGGWQTGATATYGKQDELAQTLNIPNTVRLAQAIADTDPATSYNLFGDGSWTNPMTIERVRGSRRTENRDTSWTVAFRADGPLIAVPAGNVRLAIGSEYREERFASASTNDASSLSPVTSHGLWPGARKVSAVYGEILLPVISEKNGIPGVRLLSLSVAGRYEHYNDFGSTTNPKIGLSWSPATGFTVRSNYGTSFRAPTFIDLLQSPGTNLYFVYPLADPTSPTGTRNTLLLRGNDPDIGPEKATTWTMGVDIEPKFARGLKLSATYFNIRYRDRIADPSTALLNILNNRATYAGIITDSPSLNVVQGYFASPYFSDFFGIPATGVGAIVDARTQNLSQVSESGMDVSITANVPALGGRLLVDATGTYLFNLKQRFTASAPQVNLLNTVGNPVDLRLRGGATWTRGGLALTGHINFTDSYRNTIVTPAQRVASWTAIDAQIAYDFSGADSLLKGLRLALSATNLFDRDPPYVNFNWPGVTAVGYDPQNASAVGRVISLQVTKKW